MHGGGRSRETFRQLRLMSDYSCVVPVWGNGRCLGSLSEELGISEELERDLLAWQEHFEHHFHHYDGWDAPEHAASYCEVGPRLLQQMQAELQDVTVHLDLWPCSPGWCPSPGGDHSPGGGTERRHR